MANTPNVSPAGISSIPLLGLLNAVKNLCLSPAGLTIGSSSAAKVKIANTTNISNNGVMRAVSSAEIAFTATSDDIAADAGSVQECVYLVLIDAAGTGSLYKGTIATGSGNAVIPATPEGYTCVGYLRLAVAAGATSFDATSDNLSATHLTDTYVDLSCNAANWGQ